MSRTGTDAQGRLDHGPPIAVVDIGSNSVRLVAYEGLTRSPTEIFNEKALCGLGREVQSTRLAGRRRGPACAVDAQAVSRAVRHHGRDEDARHRHRRLPRRQKRPGFHQARANAPSARRSTCSPAAGGRAHRARRDFRRASRRRRRRRSRRRLARARRCARHARAARRDPAARRLGACGYFGEVGQEGGEVRQEIAQRPAGAAGRARIATSMPSAAPGARWRGCTCGRPAIRCT